MISFLNCAVTTALRNNLVLVIENIFQYQDSRGRSCHVLPSTKRKTAGWEKYLARRFAILIATFHVCTLRSLADYFNDISVAIIPQPGERE